MVVDEVYMSLEACFWDTNGMLGGLICIKGYIKGSTELWYVNWSTVDYVGLWSFMRFSWSLRLVYEMRMVC